MKSLEVQGSHEVESFPCIPIMCYFVLIALKLSHLREMPGDTTELFFRSFDPALKPTVGVGVALVEVEVTLIVEKAATSFR